MLSTGHTSEPTTHQEELDLMETFPRCAILTEQRNTHEYTMPHRLGFPHTAHTVRAGHWPFSGCSSVLLMLWSYLFLCIAVLWTPSSWHPLFRPSLIGFMFACNNSSVLMSKSDRPIGQHYHSCLQKMLGITSAEGRSVMGGKRAM